VFVATHHPAPNKPDLRTVETLPAKKYFSTDTIYIDKNVCSRMKKSKAINRCSSISFAATF
jgi:hypothetical protein